MSTGDLDRDARITSPSALPAHDVTRARAERLRRHCHAALARSTRSIENAPEASAWRRWLAPALGGAWSVVYLVETLRRALAFYRS